MIRLDLGEEPDKLRAEREKRLPSVIQAFNAGTAFSELLDEGYQVAKASLHQRQFGKCAFCEKTEDARQRPVEHFRPKKGAQDKVGGEWQAPESSHYWWLTWAWSNLLFSCVECNRPGNKGNRFPLEPGSCRISAPVRPVATPLPATYLDVSAERPLLLDPRQDDPLEHLEWLPVDRRQPCKKWHWSVTGRSPRGDMTAEVLGLMHRIDEINRHLIGIQLQWDEAERHWRADRQSDVQRIWDDLVRIYVDDPQQPFRAAAWCALQALGPAAEQRRRGLTSPSKPQVTRDMWAPPPVQPEAV